MTNLLFQDFTCAPLKPDVHVPIDHYLASVGALFYSLLLLDQIVIHLDFAFWHHTWIICVLVNFVLFYFLASHFFDFLEYPFLRVELTLDKTCFSFHCLRTLAQTLTLLLRLLAGLAAQVWYLEPRC